MKAVIKEINIGWWLVSLILTDVGLGRVTSRMFSPAVATDPVSQSRHQGRAGGRGVGRVLGYQVGDLDIVSSAGHRAKQTSGAGAGDSKALVSGVVF